MLDLDTISFANSMYIRISSAYCLVLHWSIGSSSEFRKPQYEGKNRSHHVKDRTQATDKWNHSETPVQKLNLPSAKKKNDPQSPLLCRKRIIKEK